MTYQYRFAPTYTDSVRAYATNKDVKAALADTLTFLADDPLHHPQLKTHRVKRAQGETFTSYVDNEGRRLVWRLIGNTIVLLLVGEHDPVYRRAENLRLEIDDSTETLRVYDADPSNGAARPYQEIRAVEGTLFLAWTDAELGGFGLAPEEVRAIRGTDSDEELLALDGRMKAGSFEIAMNLFLYGHPEGESAAARRRAERELADQSLDEGAVDAAEERRLARQLRSSSSRAEFAPVEPAVLAEVLSKPIEDWMVFLHPDQAKLAERSYSGPARVRGAAGTGKTVVGLHRAVHLAHTYPGRLLFTTYVRTLPGVLKHLFGRLAPDLVDRVDFVGLHSWAASYLNRAGQQFNVEPQKIEAAFNAAWTEVADEGSADEFELPRRYYREEIDWIIKGRDIRSLEAYLLLDRSGRGTPLNARHRTVVWALFDEYQHQLQKRKVLDFNDLLIWARAELRARGLAQPYAAVLVDESQDLTEVGAKLAFEIAGGARPDSLVLLGDGQQSVYPGGYSLGAIGIKVVGRSTLLRVNYRNTAEILETAWRVVEGRPFDDNDRIEASREREVQTLRHGPLPASCGFESADDHDEGLVLAISESIEQLGDRAGDMAVLAATNALVDQYATLVSSLGYPTQKLQDYDGTPTSRVKIGTFQRAKGLEFKKVFLPRLEGDTLGECRRPGEDDETYEERLDLLRRQLFVAMTRARDQLWLGWVGSPAEILNR